MKTFLFKYTENFTTKNWRFSDKNSDIHISAENIDCGYSLEPPHWGSSNEYPQSMFLAKKKNNVYPCKPKFYCIKVGFKGSELHRYVFVMPTLLQSWGIILTSTASLSNNLSCKHRSNLSFLAAHSSSSWVRLSFNCRNTPEKHDKSSVFRFLTLPGNWITQRQRRMIKLFNTSILILISQGKGIFW